MRLGSVTFQQFEIPETINFGGKQTLAVHKLPGGERVIDAMGRDDDDITWQGRFRGGNAGSRARSLDKMRIAGRPVTLTWGDFRYQVLVESFKADYQRAYEIPYTVTCVVLTAADVASFLESLGLSGVLNANLDVLTDLSSRLNLFGVTSAVSSVQAVLDQAGTFTTLSTDLSATLASALGGAQGTVTSAFNAIDGGIAAPGTDPLAIANNLLSQASAFSQMADLSQMGGTVSQMLKSL